MADMHSTGAGPTHNDDLQARVSNGVLWALGNQATSKAIGLARGIVLARLLSPEDFGVFGLAAAVLGLFIAVGDVGAGAFVIRQSEDRRESVQGAFSYCLSFAAALSLTLILSGLWLAAAYRIPVLSGILVVLAISLFLEVSSAVHLALLRKRFQFGAKLLISVGTSATSLTSAVVLAWLGAGPWAFVGAAVSASAVQCVSVWYVVRWNPFRNANIHAAIWPDIWRFGSLYVGSGVVWYTILFLDTFVVGKLLGTEALGAYTLALTYALVLPGTLGPAVDDVMLPALSSLQSDPARLRAAYLKAMRVVTAVVLPLTFGLILVAPALFDLVFGSRWTAARLPFQILLLCGLARTLLPDVFTALGRTEVDFRLVLGSLIFLAIALVIALPYQLVGVATAVSATSLGLMVASTWVAGRLLELRSSELVRNVLPYGVSVLIGLVPVLVAQAFAPPGTVTSLAQATFLLAIYPCLLRWRFRTSFLELHELFAVRYLLALPAPLGPKTQD